MSWWARSDPPAACVEGLEQDPAVMRIGICQPDEAKHRRPDIGVIGEDSGELPLCDDTRTDHAEPGLGDVFLEIAVVPGKARLLDKAARRVGGGRAGRMA